MADRTRDDGRRARSAARLAAVQALYQMEVTGAAMAAVRSEFEAHRLGAEIEEAGGPQYHDADLSLFRAILSGVVESQARIDRLTDEALVAKWPLGRIDPTLRALFRAGGYELTMRPDVPARVVIGEYVDVAKAFYAEGKEAKFVNAVLDHMAREVRPGELAPR
jgi:N utilization substance protein B